MKLGLIALLYFMHWLESLLYTEPHIKAIREGNYFMKSKKYDQAETEYRRAMDMKPNDGYAPYNLGVKTQVLNRLDESIKIYQNAVKNLSDKKDKAAAFHNIGNAYIKKQEWQNAIDAYKSALRNAPDDMDTKYNLAYAQLKLKKQQQPPQQPPPPQDDKQDKNQDKQQDKNEEDKKNNKDEKPNSKESKPKLSKEQMQKIINALNSQDQRVNEKMKQYNKESNLLDIEKDW